MAEFAFVEGNVPSAANWNANVRDQLTIVCTSSTRPGSPTAGRRIYETDTGKEYVYVGSTWTLCGDNATYSAWTTFTPTWTSSGTQPAIGNGSISAAYKRVGQTCYLRLGIAMGSTTTYGTGYWYFPLPLSMNSLNQYGAGHAYGASYWPMHPIVAGVNIIPYVPNGSGSTILTTVTPTTPFTWASTNSLYMSLTFEWY